MVLAVASMTHAGVAGEPQVLIVELADPPPAFEARSPSNDALLEVRSASRHVRAQQDDLTTRLSQLGPIRVCTRMQALANAIAIELPADTALSAVAALPGVRSVHRAQRYRVHLSQSVVLMGAAGLWSMPIGTNGDDVTIAVIDSGIDPTNPLLAADAIPPTGFPRGDATLTNGKVIVAKAYLPDGVGTPMDENGHGTYIASIAAGNAATLTPIGLLSGIAPNALIGNYRAFDASGSGRSDLVAKAIEDAFLDGFDVANLSFGTPVDFGSDPLLLQVIENATAGGMTVVVSAGNAGPGDQTIEFPGVSQHAITVGASSNAHAFRPAVGIVDTTQPQSMAASFPGQLGAGGNTALPSGDLAMIDVERGCRPVDGASLQGTVALAERGGCSYRRKARAAARAGAVAIVVYNREGSGRRGGDGLVTMNLRGSTIPGLFVGHSGGLSLRGRVGGDPSARVRLSSTSEVPSQPDVVAPFSSRGPSDGPSLKPDVVAPGESIYAAAITTPVERGVSDPSGFTAASGTSQAAAHVSGAVALLRQVHPDWTPEQIKSALIGSAAPVTNDDGSAASILDVGGGRIDVLRASLVPVTVSPPSFTSPFLTSEPDGVVSAVHELRVTNVGPFDQTLTVTGAAVDGRPGLGVEPLAATLSVAAGATAKLQVRVSMAPRMKRGLRTGAVVFTASDGTTVRTPLLAVVR